MILADSSSPGAGATIGTILVIVVAIAAYWVPALVALIRQRQIPNVASVIVINAFLGWTVVGWVVALAMAVRSRPQPAYPPPYYGGPYPPPPSGQFPSGPGSAP